MLKGPTQIIDEKLHTPLSPSNAETAALFMQGGYKQSGYGVPAGAAIDGSFAIEREGNQGYFVNGGKEIFLSTVASMRDFFSRRARLLGKPIKYIIKPGIGGQHTPFQAIAAAFEASDPGSGAVITGEYELGKDYEASLSEGLKKLGAGWDELAVIPSSKSGSTDETMMIFTEIFYILLKKVADKESTDGKLFADTVLKTMHEVNFTGGRERPAKELFKGFTIELVHKNLQAAGLAVGFNQVKKVFATVLGNMFFETTDRPSTSRLSAFVRNSGLDKELGEDAPGFGAMFDNVGGRWTADLHMATFLAYYGLDAEKYWNARYEGIKKVRAGTHRANKLAEDILGKRITGIALIVPDELFWFGKAIEQNFNESIWQKGFANLIAVKTGEWKYQKARYSGKPSSFVIDISKEFKLKGLTRQELAESLGELFTTFYGMTHTVGNVLISKALEEKSCKAIDIDVNDLNKPATRIFQQNLYLRQPYVELGKGLLEAKLKALQEKGPAAIEEEAGRIRDEARKAGKEGLVRRIEKAAESAKKDNRKFVPFLYLEGGKFFKLRERLIKMGIEWVMQGTGDQHINYQQVLAQPRKYLPFIISFVPEKAQPGRPAVGFAKGYLDNVSPDMVRDLFAEASYKALTEPRTDEAGEEVRGAAGIFLRTNHFQTGAGQAGAGK